MSTPNPVSAFAVACRKLQEARAILHGAKLVKSGENKFANYKYFELADFLPATLNAFTKVGLCGIVSFTLNRGVQTRGGR